MGLNNRILELEKWITELSNCPSGSQIIDLLRAQREIELNEILELEDKLKQDFYGVLEEFKWSPGVLEKLMEYAWILCDIRPKLWLAVAEEVVFLLYINNSVKWMNMSFTSADSINFGQYFTEYVEWEKFREYFWDSDIPDDFFEMKWEYPDDGWKKSREHMEAIFLVMKKKFQFN